MSHTARKAALFVSAEERGSNHSVLAERDFSPWLRWSPVHGWWLIAAGIAAWWVVRTRVAAADGVALAIGGTWLLLALAFPVARYRLPIAAPAAVLVVCGAVDVARRAATGRRLAQAGAILAGLTALAFAPVRESAEGLAHVNLALAHLAAGDGRAVAERALRRALAVEPTCGPAHEVLGRMAFDDGDAAGAYDHFVPAAQDRRSRFTAQVAAIPALVRMNRLGEAAKTATGLLGERSDDPELLANAALVAAASGDRSQAASLLASARRLAPSHPAVRRTAAATGL